MPKTLAHTEKSNMLIDKGMSLLWSKGYNGTSVNDIVKAAGVPKGSFYFYFENKEDFVVKTLDRYFKNTFEVFFKVLNDESVSPKQRLLNFYEYRITILKNEQNCRMGCMAANLGNEMGDHNEAIRNIITAKCNVFKEEITDVVKRAQENEEIKIDIDARFLVEFIEDVLKGAMITMKEMQNSYSIDNSIKIIKSLLIK